MNSIRSPFFYVGDKYKLMPQLSLYFPKDISVYIEPFVGGGSSFLNTEAKKYILNDVDKWIIKLHREIKKYSKSKNAFIFEILLIIKEYNLSCSFHKDGPKVPESLKKKYPKTYYSHFNKDGYNRLKEDFNKDKSDIKKLYVLLIYGFNHMIRFNKNGDFNLPVGNVDFNNNVYNALENYFDFCKNRKISFYNKDYKDFLNKINLENDNTFIYFDPPYLISNSEYNKLWSEKDEKELYDLIDFLDKKGVKFGITNLLIHKNITNDILLKWSKKYNVYVIKSNYISFNDNTIKSNSKEIYVTNYGKR